MEYIIKIHRDIIKQIIDFANINPYLECGGYLIGEIKEHENQINFIISAIFLDENQGTKNRYCFFELTRKYLENYCKTNMSNYKVIGNFHSHGEYHAIFSKEDKIMEENSPNNYCHLIYSPKYNEITCEIHIDGKRIVKPRITFFGTNREITTNVIKR